MNSLCASLSQLKIQEKQCFDTLPKEMVSIVGSFLSDDKDVFAFLTCSKRVAGNAIMVFEMLQHRAHFVVSRKSRTQITVFQKLFGIGKIGLVWTKKFRSSIQFLDLSQIPGNLSIQTFKFIKYAFPNIRSLRLSSTCVQNEDEARRVGRCFPKLQRLDLSSSDAFCDKNMRTLVSSCKSLQELQLSYCNNLTDSMLADMCSLKIEIKNGKIFLFHPPQQLRKIDVRFCPQVTETGLRYLRTLPKLRTIQA